MTKAKLVQFRRGRHIIKERHYLVEIEGCKTRKDAEKYVGKNVSWKSSVGKGIKGKVVAPHGNKGIVRAIFEKGLPGQAMTQEVSLE